VSHLPGGIASEDTNSHTAVVSVLHATSVTKPLIGQAILSDTNVLIAARSHSSVMYATKPLLVVRHLPITSGFTLLINPFACDVFNKGFARQHWRTLKEGGLGGFNPY